MQGHIRQMARLIMDCQHLARQHLDLSHTDHVQGWIGHPRNDAKRLDLAGSFAGQRAVFRWHVVDGNHRQPVLGLAFAQLAQNPVTVGLRYRYVLFAARIPALKQRLCSHRVGQRVHLRQDFETPVENELGTWVSALDITHQSSHACNLPLLRLRRFGNQIKRIQRVQKKRPIALLPQRLDDLRQVKRAPARRGLIHHNRAPGRVLPQLPFRAHEVEVRPGRVDLAHGDVGGHGSARIQPVLPAGHTHVAGLHHGDVKRAQGLPRDICAVIEGRRQKRGLRTSCLNTVL